MKYIYKISVGSGSFFLDSRAPIAFTSMSSRKPRTVVMLVDLGPENTGLLVLEAFSLVVEEIGVLVEEKLFKEMQARKPLYLESVEEKEKVVADSGVAEPE